jgi:hypothetical protein
MYYKKYVSFIVNELTGIADKGKNPVPETPALISPHRGKCLPLDNQWNNGMQKNWNAGTLEYWKTGQWDTGVLSEWQNSS